MVVHFIDKSRDPAFLSGEMAESDDIPLSRDRGDVLVVFSEIWYIDAMMFCVVRVL